MIPYRTKFRRTEFFGGQNFRHQVEISAVSSDEMFSSDSYFPIQFKRKICFKHEICINLTCFRFQRTKYFGGQKFSADKIFGSKSDFRQFCPPKFCPIRKTFFPVGHGTSCGGVSKNNIPTYTGSPWCTGLGNLWTHASYKLFFVSSNILWSGSGN